MSAGQNKSAKLEEAVGEWQKVDFANAPIEIIDGDRGINYPSQSDFSSNGYCLFLNTGNVTNNGFNFQNCSFISIEKDRMLRKGRLQRHDLILTTRGTIGNIAYFDSTIPIDNIRINSGMVIIRPDQNTLNPKYLYQFLKSSYFKCQIESLFSGSAQPQLPIRDICKIILILPPLEEQRAIAHILGTLDDKIELNRRTNETLEAMAQALFKFWFVDFGPVRAKMEGRWRRGQSLPGLPAHLFDLFPDRLVDSELGEIPEGWEVKAIGELAEIVGGSTPDTTKNIYWEDGIHFWVTPKDLSNLNAPALLSTKHRITNSGLSQISSGLLPPGTVLLSSRAPIGYLAVTEIFAAINQGFIAMKPKPGISNLFLLLWAHSAHDKIVSRANGSTFLEINKTNFRTIPVEAPPESAMFKFDQLSRSLYEQIVQNLYESHALATIRDTLLPKLISGELRVRK
ncbi:MAG TPA: restriction endonuclease subunit S [Caldisericia bacterium]|nr:restriction endonuclease subunit S [Caldisericia bacterium]